MLKDLDTRTPVLILGGKENSLSLARHFGRLGIPVRASGPANCWAMYSRYCRERFPIPHGQDFGAFWEDLLLSEANNRLDGHIVLACSDEALEFLARRRDRLAPRYILDDADPALQEALLDKRRTLELAQAAGVGTPKFWTIKSHADLEPLKDSVLFPVMVKPIHSHKFTRVFGCKLFIVERSFDELSRKVRAAQEHNIDVMIVEMIPGPDELLSSYYTYVDKAGNNLFHFTKRVLRRFPMNRGGACYHITEWLPETAELGQKFFKAVRFRGLGNIEFKRDLRDGQLKIIEVNSRFTAAQELVVRSGAPINLIIYCYLTGQAGPQFKEYRQFLRYWYPLRDALAFLEMRRRGELSLAGWLRSVLPYRHVFPLWDWGDPMPSLGAAGAALQQAVRGRA